MADYVDFIDSGDEDAFSDEEDNKTPNPPNSSRINRLSTAKMDSKMESKYFGIDEEKESKKKYLYVVQLEDEIT